MSTRTHAIRTPSVTTLLPATRATATAAVLAALLGGCLAGETWLDDPEGDELEEIGTASWALCSDGAADATVSFVDKGGASAAVSALPSNYYDHPACSDRYTVEVTGTGSATQPMSIIADWGEGLPTTESACPFALANVQVHEHTLVGINCSGSICLPVYGWQQVGSEVTMQGNWIPFFGSGFCQLQPTTSLPVLQPSWFRGKVRVAVRAYGWALFFPAYKRAEAGLYSAPIIY